MGKPMLEISEDVADYIFEAIFCGENLDLPTQAGYEFLCALSEAYPERAAAWHFGDWLEVWRVHGPRPRKYGGGSRGTEIT